MARETTQPRVRASRAAAGPTRRAGARGRSWRLWAPLALVVLALGIAVPLYVLAGRPADGGAATGSDPVAVLQTADFHALAFSPDEPDMVFFGHHNGVMRSADGGRTWKPLVERQGFDGMSLAVSPARPRQVYLAGHDVFEVSTDGGASWRPVAHNLPGTDIHGFAMSPDDPHRLYAFVVPDAIFRSGDGGQTWARLGGQVPGDVMALAAAGGSPAMLYAGSMRGGVLRSADGGETWAPAAANLGGVMALAVDPATRQTIYAGGDRGLHKSTDGGTTWSKLPFPGTNVVALAVSPVHPNVVLAITVKDRQGLVFRSEDGGQSWGQSG